MSSNSIISVGTNEEEEKTENAVTDKGVAGGIGWRNKRRLRLEVDGLRVCSAPSSPGSPGNCNILDLTWDEEEARFVKKSRTEGTEGTKDPQWGPAAHATTIRRIIKRLEEESRTLSILAVERNTKKEIKEMSKTIRSLTSQLTTKESKTLLQTLGSKMMIEAESENKQDEMVRRIEKLEKDNKKMEKMLGDLTIENKKLRDSMSTRGTLMTEDIFKKGDSYDDFAAVEKMIWPREIYKVVSTATGSPLEASKETDLVMLLEQPNRIGKNEVIMQTFQDRYPELEDIKDTVGAITVITRISSRAGNTAESERWIFKAEIDEGGKEWFQALKEIKELAQKVGRTRLALYPPGEDTDGERTRKMLEFIYRDSGIKCFLYTTRKEKGVGYGPLNKVKERNTEALIFHKEGCSYAELLKTFKDKVKPETEGAKAIRTIRESRDGKMIVVLNKDNKKATEELQTEIRRIGDLKFQKTTGVKEQTLFINEIDGVTTRDEVLEALSRATGKDKGTMQVGQLRKSYAGNQAVTVRIVKDKAMELARQETIRIGLSLCPVREKVEVVQCFRCWKYGHIGKDCKEGSENSRLCRKCGENGHVAKHCSGDDEYCLTCKERGHKAGTGRCPEFRKALARERREGKKRKRY